MTTATRTRSRDLLASLMLVVAPPVALALALTWRDRLPDPLPRHWNFVGDVDGTSGFVEFTAFTVGASVVLAVLGLVLVWMSRDRDVAGFSVPLLGGLAWLLAVLYAGTLEASLDVERAEDVGLPVLAIVAALAAGALVGVALSKLLPVEAGDGGGSAPRASTITLGDEEKVVWLGGASSFVMLWTGVAMTFVGGLVLVLQGAYGLILVGVGLLLASMHRLRVRIDASGVRASWGLLGWPGGLTPLAEIDGVRTATLRPTEWGGWGYRMSRKGRAHLVRAGDGFVLQRRGATDLWISVDGADAAVDVLTALLERAAR